MAKTFKMEDSSFLVEREILRKQDNPIIVEKKPTGYHTVMPLPYNYDRSFPLETVELQSFNQKHEKDVKSATIHIGQSADEFARSMNLLAFVVVNDIYFRSNKFNPTTEEGRKLLAHELTHVAQFKSKGFEEKEELEIEAEQEEKAEAVEIDPLETITAGGQSYQVRKSQQKKLVYMLANEIIQWVERQRVLMKEEEYLALLIAFKEMITGYDMMCEPKTQADRWIEQELKDELRRRTMVV